MSLAKRNSEGRLLGALVLLGAACSGVLAYGAHILGDANTARRDQLRKVADRIERPDAGEEGPIDGAEGLFGRRLLRVQSEFGATVVFDGKGVGGRS